MSIVIPAALMAKLPHFVATEPTIGGISGGRTSALMHVLSLAANRGNGLYRGVYANTGKEHERTLVFLKRLQEATEAPLTWVEFRPPERLGMAPKHSRTEEVTFETAARAGQPFEDFLETLAAYRREAKDADPIAPHAIMRVCTAYMKVRTQARWSIQQVGAQYTSSVGLRFDEPRRVKRLLSQATANVAYACPLSDAGITKADVLAFWSAQTFDLDIPEYLGNCNKCFLKDEADIAQSYYEEPEDGDWWLAIQNRYGDFKRGGTSMRTIFAEAKVRMEVIRPAVRAWKEPQRPADFDPYRWRLLVKQETKRREDGPSLFSCACESALLGVEEE